MFFPEGATIVRRNVHREGRISSVESARVVRHDAGGLLTWTAAGSEVMHRTTLDGDPIRKMSVRDRAATATMLSPAVWRETSVLILSRPAESFSTWWFFGPEGSFRRWYVNLEAPLRFWAGGVDTQDHALDIEVAPDRSWAWKDEDELAERIGHPSYWSAAEAVAIRSAGERVVTMVEAGVFPFDDSLTRFRPDPAWTPSVLPPEWDMPPAAS